MTGVEIRPLGPDDDMDAQVDLGQRAFGPYSAAQRASWTHVARIRVSQGLFLGAFIEGRPVGAAVVHDMRQWWHGRVVPLAGVASVKVAPEQRGKGIGRRLMTALLELIAARGYPLSALYPATVPLYRSLGWELAGGKYQAVIPARSLRTLVPPDAAARGNPGPAAEVRRAGPADAAAVNDVIGRCHEAARDSGPLTWDTEPAARWLSREDMYAYLSVDGFAAYRWQNGHEELLVERVHGATPEAIRELWSIIASHSSVADTVRVLTGPADPFWWLTQERDASIRRWSMWMLRVIDAPAAMLARGFPAAVSLTVPIVINDPTRPANSGRWELQVGEGKGILIPNDPPFLPAPTATDSAGQASQGAKLPAPTATDSAGQASRGAKPAPLTLGARGLAALYAGTPVATLRLAGLASGGSPDTDNALDAAFAATPYMLDDF